MTPKLVEVNFVLGIVKMALIVLGDGLLRHACCRLSPSQPERRFTSTGRW